jgi:hypothetical protein
MGYEIGTYRDGYVLYGSTGVKPHIFDPTLPVSIEFWLTDLGASRPRATPMFVIATTELRALAFAADVAAVSGLDLETISRVNLDA